MRDIFQTEEEEGVVSFDEVSALLSAVADEGTGSITWASIVKAAIRLTHFRAHCPGIIPEVLSACEETGELSISL